MKTRISFIIPAFNEEHNIAQTIAAIHRYGGDPADYEILVIDHGSGDRTEAVAQDLGATVYRRPGGTIASLRNFGAGRATGEIIVFLDADVDLTAEWNKHFPEIERELKRNSQLVTGSHCSAPPDGTWIERFWFRNFATQRHASHIGSGHLIIRRDFFLELNGFDSDLRTGEDYEFSRRALSSGAKIVNDLRLEVIHRGFPKTVGGLIRREAWHGQGDLVSVRAFVQSKVAVASAIFLLLNVVTVMSLVLQIGLWKVPAISLAILLGMLVASSLHRFRHCALRVVAVNALIFYFYYTGRSIALFRRSSWWRDKGTVKSADSGRRSA